MLPIELGFWFCAFCVCYTYLVYPFVIALLARALGKTVDRSCKASRTVSVVIAAYNAEDRITRRIEEFLKAFSAYGLEGEIIIVSDGSCDATAAVARSHRDPRVRVLEFTENRGKAAALTAGCASARHEILVFGDVRQVWASDALDLLLSNFADPLVGAASGDLILQSPSGVLSGVGLYWRHEKWLRKQESRLWSSVGVTGAICAVRRELFQGIPSGTILDDVYWPLTVVTQGCRVVHDARALAYDRLPENAKDEFSRKVRTLSGNFQLLTLLPSALLPWRNPVWFQFVSHKLGRLVVPWALLAILVTSMRLANVHWVYRAALIGQVSFYLVSLVGFLKLVGLHSRLASTCASFVVLNTAAWLSFWKWVSGQAGQCWKSVEYTPVRSGANEATSAEFGLATAQTPVNMSPVATSQAALSSQVTGVI
jgi:biofilm PGA synthesis N-glycosyltransferase PgaC